MACLSWIFLILFIGCSDAARNMEIELQNTRYIVHNKELVKHAELALGKYKKHKTIHFEIEFNRPIENFDVKIVVQTPRQKIPLIDVTVNGCDCLRTDADLPQLIKLISNAMRDGSQIPKKCPVPANERIIIERFYLNPKFFPSFTPEMNTITNFSVLTDKKLLLSLSVNFIFKKV